MCSFTMSWIHPHVMIIANHMMLLPAVIIIIIVIATYIWYGELSCNSFLCTIKILIPHSEYMNGLPYSPSICSYLATPLENFLDQPLLGTSICCKCVINFIALCLEECIL